MGWALPASYCSSRRIKRHVDTADLLLLKALKTFLFSSAQAAADAQQSFRGLCFLSDRTAHRITEQISLLRGVYAQSATY